MAFQTNCDGTYYIAKVCAKLGIKVGYISTDYVFPGTGSDFQEIGDQTGPLNVYGSSKLAGEEAIKTLLRKYFIVRTSWVFGKHGKNFVQSMLRLAENHCQLTVVSDQIGSPTYTEDLAALLCDMMQTEKYGVYHATNEGTCSWAEFAKEIFKIAGKHVIVIPVTSQD